MWLVERRAKRVGKQARTAPRESAPRLRNKGVNKMDTFNRTTRRDRGWLVAGPVMLVALVAVLLLPAAMQAQNIGWEGETGVFVTPLAYTAGSPKTGLGTPLLGYHYLNGGPVLGDFYEASVTAGAFSRVEFGYTRAFHSLGGDPNFSALWNNGFNIIHAKVNLLPETAGKPTYVPPLGGGFRERRGLRKGGGPILEKNPKK